MLLTNNSEYKIFNIKHKVNSELIFTEPIPMTELNILEDIIRTVKYIHNFCTKHNIDYCISDGTLLGCYRHNGIIPWDGDLDIMIFKDGFFKLKKLIDDFSQDGFEIFTITPGFKVYYNKKPMGELFVYDYDTSIDMYRMAYPYIQLIDKPLYITSNIYYPSFITSDIYYPWQKYKSNDIFPLKKAYFENFIVNIPNNTLNILNTTYNNSNLKECHYDKQHTEQHRVANNKLYKIGSVIEKIITYPLLLFIYYIVHRIINVFLIKFK